MQQDQPEKRWIVWEGCYSYLIDRIDRIILNKFGYNLSEKDFFSMGPRFSQPPYGEVSKIENLLMMLKPTILLYATVDIGSCRILNLTNTSGLHPDKSLGVERVAFLKMLAVPTEFLNLIVP